MSEDIFREIWDKGKSLTRELSVQEIEQALRPDVRRQSFSIRMYIWVWLVLLLGTVVLGILNIMGYQRNPVMLTTQIGLTLLAVVFGIYGVHLLRQIRIIDEAAESLLALVKRCRRFYQTEFEIWNLIMASTIVLLTFALNSYTDNENGRYRIGRVELFILFSALQFAFMYGVNKIAQYPIRKEMKVILSDLEANGMEGTQTLVGFIRRWRVWTIVFAIIGTILLLLGIWRAIQFGS